MAIGDVVFFDQWLEDVQSGIHNMDSDVIKVGFITNAVTPVVGDSDPRWGAGGGTNFATNEVAAGGLYSAGGPVVVNNSVTLVAGAAVFDGDDVTIAQNGANPTNARWGIIYNDTAGGKQCLGFVDYDAVINLQSGNFSILWATGGIESMDQA